jgi:hypothetical protein
VSKVRDNLTAMCWKDKREVYTLLQPMTIFETSMGMP